MEVNGKVFSKKGCPKGRKDLVNGKFCSCER